MKVTITIDGRITSYKLVGNSTIDLTVKKPLAEATIEVGSAEWALEQMKQGNAVINNGTYYYKMVDGKIQSIDSNTNIFHSIVSPSDWERKQKLDWRIYSPAPLLADAKVGDYVECREGIMQITSTTQYLAPIKCQHEFGAMYYLSSGYPCTGEHPDWKITKLIPTGGQEWQEIHTAKLLEQYPNIERDLSTVNKDDMLLLSNGDTCKSKGIDSGKWVESNYAASCVEFNFDGSRRYPTGKDDDYTCLGIISRAKPNPKQYSTLQIVEMMTDESVIEAKSESLGITLAWHKNEVWRKENAYTWANFTLSLAMLNATDWVVVK